MVNPMGGESVRHTVVVLLCSQSLSEGLAIRAPAAPVHEHF